jgi:hypothetical protein
MNISKPRANRKHHTPRRNHPSLSWNLLLFVLLCLLLPIPTHAQEPSPTTWGWHAFTSDNSPLAPGSVSALLEDSQGRIWVGTDEGLSLYQEGARQTLTLYASPIPRLYPCGPPLGWVVYVVQSGDHLYSLSRRFGVGIEAIRQANCLSDYTIYAGQALYLPPLMSSPTSSLTPTGRLGARSRQRALWRSTLSPNWNRCWRRYKRAGWSRRR